jgi:CheY-like chemotaxis protein
VGKKARKGVFWVVGSAECLDFGFLEVDYANFVPGLGYPTNHPEREAARERDLLMKRAVLIFIGEGWRPDGRVPHRYVVYAVKPNAAHILFVDDEVPVRETLSLFFRMKGMQVTAVGSGDEAVKAAGETRFNLIILDVTLDGENGLDLLRLFRRQHPVVPVVMFTALVGDKEKQEEAKARGASGWFCKGESLTVLQEGIERLMSWSQSHHN